MKITKRNGFVVLFDDEKIVSSILKANAEVPTEELSKQAAAFLAGEVIGRLAERQEIITTQDVRVAVGRKLVEAGAPLTAKRYIEHIRK